MTQTYNIGVCSECGKPSSHLLPTLPFPMCRPHWWNVPLLRRLAWYEADIKADDEALEAALRLCVEAVS